tara:strand:- start:378 stop:800 length:423 start_codon:yes stop_codon:yes gene_type:complete
MDTLRKYSTNKNLLIAGILIVVLIIASYSYSCGCGKKLEFFDASGNVLNLKVFYADWCGHCKRAKPEFERLRDTLTNTPQKINGQTVGIQLINEADNKDAVAKYKVKGYPSIILDTGDNQVSYNGERTSKSIIEWMTSQF